MNTAGENEDYPATEIISYPQGATDYIVDTNEFHENKVGLATEMALDEIPKFRRE